MLKSDRTVYSVRLCNTYLIYSLEKLVKATKVPSKLKPASRILLGEKENREYQIRELQVTI